MTFSRGFDVVNSPVYILCCVGFLANVMLLIAFIKNPLKCFRNSAAYLVGNLAVSDSMYNLFLMVNISLNHANNIADHFLFISFYSSMTTIFSIALDRFLMITYPFKHRILMSKRRMAVWIAIIWFVSSVHAVKRIFVTSDNDGRIKPGIGSVLIILTGILYGKTYLALRRQNKSMAGKKAVFSSRQKGNASKKNVLTDLNEICARVEWKNYRAGMEDERSQLQNDRAQNMTDQSRDGRVDSQDECAGIEDERDKRLHQRAAGNDECAQNQYERAQRKDERVVSPATICEVHFLQNSSQKTHKKLQSANNAKGQKFLNTIIIVACVAVVTVLVGMIGGLFPKMFERDSPEIFRISRAVILTLYCLNFSVNPFIYCLRLKQYRKTFQIVYGCKR